jgi:hypothetical protein
MIAKIDQATKTNTERERETGGLAGFDVQSKAVEKERLSRSHHE